MRESSSDTDLCTVGDLLVWSKRRLEQAHVVCAQGTASPSDEAAAIIYHVLGLDHADASAYSRQISAAERKRCEELISRRIEERIPAAYLLGEAWFAGLPFRVDRSVLIPRSPFAELIAHRFEPWFEVPPAARILEIGTGSGCIAVACALAFPDSFIVATDISAAALAVAQHNVRHHGVKERISLVNADLMRGIRGRFDLIVSNPPYVAEAELADMPAEFRYEPYAALAGGPDGLRLVRSIVRNAADHLQPGGLLALEIGAGLAALEREFPAVPFIWPEFEAGGDGVALVAACDLPVDNGNPGSRDPGN